jgi:hypothetical protein
MKKANERFIKIGKKTFYGPFWHGTSFYSLHEILKSHSLKSFSHDLIDDENEEIEEDESFNYIYASILREDALLFSRTAYGKTTRSDKYTVSPIVIISFYTTNKPDAYENNKTWALWNEDEISIFISSFQIIQEYHVINFEDQKSIRKLIDIKKFWDRTYENDEKFFKREIL